MQSIPVDLQKKHQVYLATRPLNQSTAIHQYINSSSKLNQLLRDGFNVGNPEHCKFYGLDLAQRVRNMDTALQSPELQQLNRPTRPFLVYRGINSPTLGQALEAYGYLHHPHFMSTSRLPQVASQAFAGDSCCVFRIVVDPALPSCPAFLFISHDESHESEVLFERNTYLNLVAIEQEAGQKVYRVQVSKQPTPRNPTPNSNTESTNTTIHPLITRSDVEDELSFLTDEQAQDDATAIAAIVASLRLVFKGMPRSQLEATVRELYEEIKTSQQTGGKKPRRVPRRP